MFLRRRSRSTMNEEIEEMNEYEKTELITKSKQGIKEEFNHMDKYDWDNYFRCVKDKELLSAIAVLLDAKKETKQVKCSFNNQYIDSNCIHRFLIYGEERIPLNYDNVLAIIPSESFDYFYKEQDITKSFVSCIDLLGTDSYSGKFLYAGIVNEESESAGFADLNSTVLINETEVYMIDEQSAIWKRYFAESYRLYESEQYKLAFLHAFIGFESLIEYLNSILYNVYLKEQNETLEYEFKCYNKSIWTPINLIENNILKTQSYQRLKHFENENRKIIDDKLCTILRYVNDLEKKVAEKKLLAFRFFEKLRNVLAHGDSFEREDLKEFRIYQKYYNVEENTMNFELVYCDFFECIGNMIKELVN